MVINWASGPRSNGYVAIPGYWNWVALRVPVSGFQAELSNRFIRSPLPATASAYFIPKAYFVV
jgi:hypothetical protein